ncbi:Progestin and adipoQ receptor member 4 [Homalodisca vitripennis]|nr:Progestin and adipoQ receptor member 4 [Homalodisca vitripennis]
MVAVSVLHLGQYSGLLKHDLVLLVVEINSGLEGGDAASRRDCQYGFRRCPRMSRLLVWQDMPRHLQFNPYIHTGYRPILSVWGSIHSLFYMHNETINIVTHGESMTCGPTCIDFLQYLRLFHCESD